MQDTEFHLGEQVIAGLDNQGTGPVVIGLHGFLDNASSLQPLAPYLQRTRFISLDLPGHGLSSHRPPGAQYNQADYLQDLYALIEQQQWDKVILLGHSLGGILASIFAGLFPERVAGLISLDVCGPLTEDASTTAKQMRESIVNRHQKRRNQLKPVELDKAVEARCSVADIAPEQARVILSRNLTQDASGHSFWASDPRVRTRSTLRLTESQAKAIMQQIDCPILFTAASRSFKKTAMVYQQRASWFANARCENIEGGHHAHMEAPDESGPLIRAFVEQL
ncbi:alpha/beta fold hydrolase [Alteromonas halophila]|uniref:Alpha/beta hydrolase n=1 Tax=Alteromonas halophila TaxID=516698 RepID=A0A918JSI7_9ALTE|nr:alpha/beta hydrolase [Alteromonas halophila]GGW94841.1 alpha/beta hydrolase [Alteromonas halophila]